MGDNMAGNNTLASFVVANAVDGTTTWMYIYLLTCQTDPGRTLRLLLKGESAAFVGLLRPSASFQFTIQSPLQQQEEGQVNHVIKHHQQSSHNNHHISHHQHQHQHHNTHHTTHTHHNNLHNTHHNSHITHHHVTDETRIFDGELTANDAGVLLSIIELPLSERTARASLIIDVNAVVNMDLTQNAVVSVRGVVDRIGTKYVYFLV